jgi:hypothetical protein
MSVETHLIRLESWLQAETAAQGRMLGLLEEQERAMRAADARAILASGAPIEAELRTGGARERARRELVAGLAAELGVAAESQTLGSLLERAEAEAGARGRIERLRRMRAELRALVADVLRRGRRIAGIARHHRGVLEELMRILQGGVDAEALPTGGGLIDARA